MSELGENSASKQRVRGKPWVKGQSGNPAGKPVGTRNAVLRALDAITDANAEGVLSVVVARALQGDMRASGLVLAQIVPPRPDRAIAFPLPPLNLPGGAIAAMAEIARGVGAGEITPSEADDLSRMVARYSETVTADDLAKRLEVLEAQAAQP